MAFEGNNSTTRDPGWTYRQAWGIIGSGLIAEYFRGKNGLTDHWQS